MNTQTNRTHPMAASSRLLIATGVLLALLACPAAIAAPGDSNAASFKITQPSPDEPAGTPFHYLQLPGSTFHPFGDGAQFNYAGNGCIDTAAGSTETRFLHKVVLPQDAVVKYVRLYYYDDSSADAITAFFTTYDAAGNFVDVNIVGSTDSGGYGSTLGAEMNYVVDHFTAPINLVVHLGSVTDGSVRFCGVRIAYRIPADDVIFADGFE